MNTPGDDLTSLLSLAKHNALIVAPFMRSEAFSRLLESIPVGTETAVVTRWQPADLLAGASDLGVYDLAESRTVPLFLRNDLHAKFFAADDMCLIGSANVTNTALGWRTPANLELLIPVARRTDHVVKFEEALFAGAVRATAGQRNHLETLLKKLRDLPAFYNNQKTATRVWGYCPQIGFHASEIRKTFTRSTAAMTTSAAPLSRQCKKTWHRSVPFLGWTRKRFEHGLLLQFAKLL